MTAVFIVFLTLKLLGVIEWSWIYVCVPLYYLLLEIFISYMIFKFIKRSYRAKYKENRKKYPDLSQLGKELSEKAKEFKNYDNFDSNIADKINEIKEKLEKEKLK